MLILRLWNYIRGYVIIIVEGYFLGKFINVCTHRQIRLWNVKWQKNIKVIMSISIKDFKTLRPIAKKTRCRVHIIKKKGLPFTLNRYKNRKAFVIGSGICVIAFFLISSFIWDVSVTGNSKVSTEVIMERLCENGIKLGALKYNINPDAIVDNMMLEMNDLARISISLRGTKILVIVDERVKPPDLINKNISCDLVALKDGVISSIVAKAGLEMVKVGNTVTKGQLLITGTIENVKIKDAMPLMVHSIGIVKARTWYEASAQVEQKLVKAQRTGLQKDMYSIVFFTKKFKLFHSKIPYNNSEHIETKKKLSIGVNLVLPIEMIVDQYYEYELEQKEIDIDTAKKNASDKAFALAQEQIPQNAEIVKNSISIVQNEKGVYTATVLVECIEDIGVTQQIEGR
ncbi:MAG TPA: sporulation protein YqfD [Ruminiclostridium sp.]